MRVAVAKAVLKVVRVFPARKHHDDAGFVCKGSSLHHIDVANRQLSAHVLKVLWPVSQAGEL